MQSPASPHPHLSFLFRIPVRAVAFFPDGKTIVTGNEDGLVRVIDLDGGAMQEEELPPRGHDGAITGVGVSRDGNGIISWGTDGKVLAWPMGSDRRRAPKLLFSASSASNSAQPALLAVNLTDEFPNIVVAAALPISSPSGSTIAIEIWIVNPHTVPIQAEQVRQFVLPPETAAVSLHFSQSHLGLLAVVCADKRVKILDLKSGATAAEFDDYAGSVWALAWFPGTKRVAAVSHKTIYINDVMDEMEMTEKIQGHTQTVKAVAVHPKGKAIVSGGGDRELRVWDAHTLKQIGSSPPHPGVVTNVAFSPDGTWILSVSGSKSMFLWKARELGIQEKAPTFCDTDSLPSLRDTPPPPSYSSPPPPRYESPVFSVDDQDEDEDDPMLLTDNNSAPSDPLTQYFSRYPGFKYDPDEPATTEFRHMCQHFRWRRGDRAQQEAYDDFRVALTMQFNARYGKDVRSLTAWQALCARLGVEPIPDSVEECDRIFRSTHVNLVDVVHKKGPVKLFPTVHELSAYSRDSNKIFPRENAYAGGLLKYLLRHIFNPSMDDNRT